MCPGQDLNLHALRRYHLKVVRLPISPPGRVVDHIISSAKSMSSDDTSRRDTVPLAPGEWLAMERPQTSPGFNTAKPRPGFRRLPRIHATGATLQSSKGIQAGKSISVALSGAMFLNPNSQSSRFVSGIRTRGGSHRKSSQLLAAGLKDTNVLRRTRPPSNRTSISHSGWFFNAACVCNSKRTKQPASSPTAARSETTAIDGKTNFIRITWDSTRQIRERYSCVAVFPTRPAQCSRAAR